MSIPYIFECICLHARLFVDFRSCIRHQNKPEIA